MNNWQAKPEPTSINKIDFAYDTNTISFLIRPTIQDGVNFIHQIANNSLIDCNP